MANKLHLKPTLRYSKSGSLAFAQSYTGDYSKAITMQERMFESSYSGLTTNLCSTHIIKYSVNGFWQHKKYYRYWCWMRGKRNKRAYDGCISGQRRLRYSLTGRSSCSRIDHLYYSSGLEDLKISAFCCELKWNGNSYIVVIEFSRINHV